jgi:hypothetical protein
MSPQNLLATYPVFVETYGYSTESCLKILMIGQTNPVKPVIRNLLFDPVPVVTLSADRLGHLGPVPCGERISALLATTF